MPSGGKKPFVQFYSEKKCVEYEQLVGEVSLRELRRVEVVGDDDFTLPIKNFRIIASIRFFVKKPVSYPKSVKHATKKPDLDNLVKAILDALVSARVIEDDNCVTDLYTSKRYADPENPVGVEVELTCLPL